MSALDKRAYGIMCFPSERDFKNMVHSTIISNLPVTPDDVKMSKTNYGSNILSLNEKTVRIQQMLVATD